MSVLHATKDNFDKEIMKSKEPVVIDFWASWCMPCRIMAPRFEEASNEMKGVKFVKLSTEEMPEMAEKFEVMSIPTLVMVKNGKEVDRMVGALPKEYLQAWVKKHL